MSDLSKEKMEIVKTWGLQRQMKEIQYNEANTMPSVKIWRKNAFT